MEKVQRAMERAEKEGVIDHEEVKNDSGTGF
jgi:hypothetical protein